MIRHKYSHLNSSYNRIAEVLIKGQPKPKVFAKFEGNVLLIGQKSLHWTPQSRAWRLFWKLKQRV